MGVKQMENEKPETPSQEEKQKIDVSKLIAIIPSASELKGEKKHLGEKRIRIKYDRTLNKPIAKLPSHIASELGIKTGDTVEVVVAGKKKVLFTAEVVESKDNAVAVYPVELEKQGVADNSIATIRKAR
jgi:antitoxin component of MazEF toxin-antitoxin module